MHHTDKIFTSYLPPNNFREQFRMSEHASAGRNKKEEKNYQKLYLEKVLTLMCKVLQIKLDSRGN